MYILYFPMKKMEIQNLYGIISSFQDSPNPVRWNKIERLNVWYFQLLPHIIACSNPLPRQMKLNWNLKGVVFSTVFSLSCLFPPFSTTEKCNTCTCKKDVLLGKELTVIPVTSTHIYLLNSTLHIYEIETQGHATY